MLYVMAPDLDCSSPTQEMKGYLRKCKKWNKRYFVLRERPPRLECYDSEKKYTSKGKPKRTIDLENAWNIDKKVSAKHKFLIGIYTKEEYFAASADNLLSQESWISALQKAVLNHKGTNGKTHCMYKHIWQGHVETKELSNCNNNVRINLQGPHRCCLTDNAMVFIRINNAGSSDLHPNSHVEISIASIRSCGHKDNSFFMEPGRSSGIGTGTLWMELDDGAIADDMHSTILRFMRSRTLGQDDGRQRSYSSGSGSGRFNPRSRHYYNPPPSQVGMRTSTSATPTAPARELPLHLCNHCDYFPSHRSGSVADDSRYRASSEGAKTMERPFPMHTLYRKGGSVSPHMRNRVLSQGKKPLHLQPPFHTRTSSLPGSSTRGTNSSNSSTEHLHANPDCSVSGPSPTMSEGNHSSDEFSSSPSGPYPILSQTHRSDTPPFSFPLRNGVPHPPMFPPLASPLLSATTASTSPHEYVNTQPVHSRAHSMDDNLSCGTEDSSLSTSPQTSGYLVNVSSHTDVSHVYSQSPSQCSSCSHCSDTNIHFTSTSPNAAEADDYTLMSRSTSETYPHQAAPQNPNMADYTLMNFVKNTAGMSLENKSGYVPMRPLVRSSPQDIGPCRRRSLTENRPYNGSYSPVSPWSRSPDKHRTAPTNATCDRCKKSEFPCGFLCNCTSVAPTIHPSIPLVSCHGLKVEPKNDFSQDNSRSGPAMKNNKAGESPPKKSDDYALMDFSARKQPTSKGKVEGRVATLSESSSTSGLGSSTSGLDNDYLPMNPMNGRNGKSVVGAILSVAESRADDNSHSIPQYPHQVGGKSPLSPYSTNSLDRSNSHNSRRRTTSIVGNLVAGKITGPRSRSGLKSSMKLRSDQKPATSESKSNQDDDSTHGGEYVSIDFDKAKRQIGKPYVALTTSPTNEEPDFNRRHSTPKPVQDSNRNFLPSKQLSPKDDYVPIKPDVI